MTEKVKLCLWFDGQAEEAATFYTSLLPDSRIDGVHRSPSDYPAGKAGDVLTVEFTLAGRSYVGLNGGAGHPLTDALSLQVDCDDQAEVDRLWDALLANGGQPVACGWITDRWGLSWQIAPRALIQMITSSDRAAAARAMAAMMTMVKIDLSTIEKAFAGEG
jgi:2-polyprenyl-6-hydroxyphenyl methylase/3-demethylubiquinone-9 3-methyltransferase